MHQRQYCIKVSHSMLVQSEEALNQATCSRFQPKAGNGKKG